MPLIQFDPSRPHRYVYPILPNDWWDGFIDVADWLRWDGPQYPEWWDDSDRKTEYVKRLNEYSTAVFAFGSHRHVAGRDDTVIKACVSSLPSECSEPLHFFTFKLSHAGRTFVVSPVELPWLRDQKLLARCSH